LIVKLNFMNYKQLFSLVFIGISYLTQAQIQMYVPKQVRLANTEFRNENFCAGAEVCAKAFSKIERKGKSAIKMKGDLAFKTAECYRETDNMKDAHEWYEKAIILKHYEAEPLVYYYNGEMLRALGEFKKAEGNYKKYKELAPEDKRGDVGLRSCEIHQDFKINKTRHVVTNVAALNKEVFEMAPMIAAKKENNLYFSSTRDGGVSDTKDPRSCENYMDLWVSELDKKGNYMQPKLVPGELINTEDNEGTVCFDGRGKTMFFTRCPNEKKMNLGCDIWVSELKGKEWGEPTKIVLKGHDSISVGHPCVTEDGKFMIFASDMPGGFGGRDLYYTSYNKKTDSWEAPINMGAEINTAGNELFPTFALNGDLLFATDGMPGMGGLDIFRAAKAKDKLKWENPKNVGFPLNSVSNDYALIEVADKKGYFTSERVGSVGKNQRPDIWMYEMPPNLFDLRVNTVEALNAAKRIEGVTVTVKSDAGETWEGVTQKDGSIFWDKKPNGDRFVLQDKNYTVSVAKAEYESVKEGSFSTFVNYDQNFVIDMPLIKKEAPIRLPEVRYPLNQWTFVNDSTINSTDSLNYVYDLLVKYPNLKLELSSHTDARSGNIYNQVLSENRAKACVKYLVEEKGIDAKRIVPVGKGEEQPRTVWLKDGVYMVDEPADTAGVKKIVLVEKYINSFMKKEKDKFTMLHQLNRRTEGKVLDMNFDPALAPAVPEDYFKFKDLPKNTKK
jgi:peptidoglycan-associated lipoprotein